MEQKLKPVAEKDVYSARSDRRGIAGLAENILRKFKILGHLVLLAPLYIVGSVCVGLALMPGFFLFHAADSISQNLSSFFKFWILGTSLGLGYFCYGFSLVLIAPFLNFLFRTKLHEWRGPYYSLPAIKWYIHNGLTYLVRFTFMEFITPTPFNILFFRMMGAKIGEGTIINTVHISDPSMIEMGQKVTLGGSVTIVGHYGQGGYLVLAPVKIGDKATIGLRAIIMGGVEIGAGAKVLPNSVVLPKTKIPAGETWGGVPAQKIEISSLSKVS